MRAGSRAGLLLGASLIAAGLWAASYPAAAREARVLIVCSAGCEFVDPADAAAAVADGDEIVIEGGHYGRGMIIRAARVTVTARQGASLVAALAEGKAAIVAKGDGTTIVGLDCSGISAPNRNGACVRLEGRGLTLRQVYFHDSEEGVLTAPSTGQILIEDSRFERLGQDGYAHGLYAGAMDRVVIRRSLFLSSRSEGHEVKSRAAETVIEDSVIASLDGVDSRLVDVPNGGILIIRRCFLEKGRASSNSEMIGYGLEGIHYADNEVRLDQVTAVFDRAGGRLYNGRIPLAMDEVTEVGGDAEPAESAGLRHYPDRAAAGIAAYPAIPEP